jgi:inner membrane protein
VEDIVLSPVPGNPLCWTAFVVGTSAADYIVLSANVAPLPAVSGAPSCPYDESVSTAPRTPIVRDPSPQVRWLKEYRTPLAVLRTLRAEDCEFDALLRFARVPYVTPLRPGPVNLSSLPSATRIVGDLRYDRRGLDFSDVVLAGSPVCPRFVPGWTPPRAALFDMEMSR